MYDDLPCARPDLPGHPCCRAVLRIAGLHATPHRLALTELLFTGNQRSATAEDLHRQALEAGSELSLAAVRSTLQQFCEVGLIPPSWYPANAQVSAPI